MNLRIAHLYPKHLNIYGDQGNIDTLVYRAQKRGIKVKVRQIMPRQKLSQGSFDLLFAGGGQDSSQLAIVKDLQTKRKVLTQASNLGIPMLTICGSYQLFGKYFKPLNRPKLKGIGIFNAYTIGSNSRKIGNLVTKAGFGNLVGFENHSGNTFLSGNTKPLGQVIVGWGNNDQDKSEGAVVKQTYGCYLHGSLLPKNPHFADLLLEKALKVKYGKVKLKPLKDTLEWQAHHTAVNRAKKLSHPLLKYMV